jgi:diguanylate cyclase (GGDEF)-like protein/PAS domain S-box-containing protein
VKRFRPHILVACLLGVLWLTGTQTLLFNSLSDLRAAWYPRTATGNIVVVAIDTASIQKIGVWPWPRSLHAELITKLQKAGVEDVALDIDFSSSSTPAFDETFAAALRQAGSVILPVFKQPSPIGIHVNEPLPLFRSTSWAALVNVAPDERGVVRQYPFGDAVHGHFVPSMAVQLAGGSKSDAGSFWLDFSINWQSIPVVSYADVIAEVPAVVQSIKGKKVIVGGTALELGDRFTVAGGKILAGPVLQALAAESLEQNRALRKVGTSAFWAAAVLLAGLMLLGWRQLSGWKRAGLLAAGTILTELGAAAVQAQYPIICDTSPLVAMAMGYFVAITLDELDFLGMLSRVSENRFQRIAMSIGDGLICTDSAGVITLCNPAASEIFKAPAHELVGQPIETIIRDPQTTGARSIVTRENAEFFHGIASELEGYRKGSGKFPVEVCISSWQGEGQPQYGVVVRDITARKRESEKIRRLAENDTLTGLANRYTLGKYVEKEIKRTCEINSALALLLFDLDKFKEINDTLGHAFGDKVIVAVARKLQAVAGKEGFVARLGGDEFAIVVVGSHAARRATALCKEVVEAFADQTIDAQGQRVRVRASVGAALIPKDAKNAEELFANADLALYRAKSQGRGISLFFEPQFRTEFESRLSLEGELQRAVIGHEFELFYQPQINLKNGVLVGAEALIRWRHPERGLIAPAEFIPVVNGSPLSDKVGKWVIESACAQGAAWSRSGHRLRIAVNLAPSQLQSFELPDMVRAALSNANLSADLLELEITEDSMFADEEHALRNIRAIQRLGVRMAFDDFGTGYASLSYLKKFRLDVLKIDRSFVMGLGQSSDDMAIVSAAIALGRQFGLSVIAEGIEDASTADVLRQMGCSEGQGYFFGKPMSVSEFEDLFFGSGERKKNNAAAA